MDCQTVYACRIKCRDRPRMDMSELKRYRDGRSEAKGFQARGGPRESGVCRRIMTRLDLFTRRHRTGGIPS